LIRSLPIRIRLTLWYTLAFSTALFFLGAYALWMVQHATIQLETKELQQRVRSVRLFLESRPDGESPASLHDAMKTTYDVTHGKRWLQVIDDRGVWVYRSSLVADVYPVLVLPQYAPQDGTYFTYQRGTQSVRAVIQPIVAKGTRYTVQTGVTLDTTLIILSDLRSHLLLLSLVGLIVSSLSGHFLSKKALDPVAAITAEARRISDKNLNARLPELEARDELSALSNTLNQMLQRIEDGYQSVRSFTANAAHELRTPVARLRTGAEVTLAFPRNADYYREACERTLETTVHMGRLIDQLLSLARADAGIAVLRFEPVNLPDLMDDIAEEWEERFCTAGIEFHRSSTKSELWADADYSALKTLLNILLENAWRYTPHGRSVSLTLCLQEPEENTQIVEVAVVDRGDGISSEDQKRIFERFYRAATPLRGDAPNTGIGLALGLWIAEQHKSTLRVESSPGIGSRFSISLPIAREVPGFALLEPISSTTM
jgi:signal transduction histidine kinase